MLGWRPGAVCSFVDYLGMNHVAQYHADNPDAPIIIRFQHPQNWWQSPTESAINQAGYVVSKRAEIRDLSPYVYFWNELNLHYENGDPNAGNQGNYETQSWYEKVGDWTLEVADRIKERAPDMRLVCPPFAYGHHEDGAPDDNGIPTEGWAGYDYLAETVRSHFDNKICGHYYWGDSGGSIRDRLYDPVLSSWHAFRWRRVRKLFQARYGFTPQFLIDEAGNFGASDPDFTDQCAYYARETLMDPGVLALCFFMWQDPTNSPGNVPNSWVQRCQNLDQHIAAMGALDVQRGVAVRVFVDGTIHTLPLEEYLRGVVPAEMPALWPMDALKAQAVWARSYALWRIANPRSASFDLYGTASDQVWNTALIHERSDRAVTETSGMVVLDGGAVFASRYVARCGRHMCPDCQGTGGTNGQTWGERACQYGARAMAQRGDTWQDISTAYYGEGVMLADIDAPIPDEGPEGGGDQPPGGDERMKIYDFSGQARDLLWLSAEWGVEIDRTQVKTGMQGNFIVTELREVEGPSEYQVWVRNADGTPYSGIKIGRYWPPDPDHPNTTGAPNEWGVGGCPDNVVCPPEAKYRTKIGITGASGYCGFSAGTGDYAGPGQGVNVFWVPIHYGGGEICRKWGMKPNTVHRLLKIIYDWIPTGSTVPAPEPSGCLVGVWEAILKGLKGA